MNIIKKKVYSGDILDINNERTIIKLHPGSHEYIKDLHSSNIIYKSNKWINKLIKGSNISFIKIK